MGRVIGEHYEGDVKVTYVQDGDGYAIQYNQDIAPTVDNVAALNADGGAQVNDGVGRLLYDFPITLIMEHATERGIPFEDLAYKAGAYEDEWHAMGRKWGKLSPQMKRQYFGYVA